MKPENHHNNDVQQELEALSPLLAQLAKPSVPMPADSYFEALANKAMTIEEQPIAKRGRIFKMAPMAASLAVAASIALAIIFWPTAPVASPASFALNTLSDNELAQLALQDDEWLEERMLDDKELIEMLNKKDAFQYLAPADDANQEYNRLLLELIDDETYMEDLL